MEDSNEVDRERANRMMGEIKAAMFSEILNLSSMGASLRKLREGNAGLHTKAMGGNEMAAALAIQMTERFEALMRYGNRLDDALEIMMKEGWMNKMVAIHEGHHDGN